MIKIGDHKINPTQFPDGTNQIWKLRESIISAVDENQALKIDWDYEGDEEIFWLMQLCDLIYSINNNIDVILNVPFLPYARQDKLVSNGSTFALNTLIGCLNIMGISELCCVDVHNPKAFSSLMAKLTNRIPFELIRSIFFGKRYDIIVYPDRSAYERYIGGLQDLPCIFIDKTRCPSTGKITEMKIDEKFTSWLSRGFENKKILMVDDICDGGGTFCLAANICKKLNCGSIGLFTSHGIYSKGYSAMKQAGIDTLYNIKGELPIAKKELPQAVSYEQV